MEKRIGAVATLLLSLSLAGCGAASVESSGAGSGSGGGSGAGGGVAGPDLISISPSATSVGSSAIQLVVLASNFGANPTILWNGDKLITSCVGVDLSIAPCSGTNELLATVPASDLAQAGTAQVTLSSTATAVSAALTFGINPPQTGKLWVRSIENVATANDLVWDSAHGKLYLSIPASDTVAPNTIATVDPVAGTVTASTPANSSPRLLSISSDSSYLWAGLDGSNAVQRYLLPGMTPDVTINLPPYTDEGQQALALQAAPVNPHTLALVLGPYGVVPGGNGIYVYDDAVQRPVSVPGYFSGGPDLGWIQWGADDSVLYGNQDWTIDEGGIANLS